MRYTNGGFIGYNVTPKISGELDGIWRYYTDVTKNIKNNNWHVSTIPTNARVSPSSIIEITGVPITLTCLYDEDVSGFSESFQWQESIDNNIWSNISGETNNTLQFVMTSGDDNTYRRCQIYRGFKNVYATGSLLVVSLNTINISSHPDDLTLYAGDTGSFAITASVDNDETINYQWQVSTDNGSNWENAPGVSTLASYAVTPPYSYNGYLYRCYLTANGANPATSDTAILTVNQNTITINSQPNAGFCSYGSPVSFSVSATITYGTPLLYLWYKSDSSEGPWTPITSSDSGFSGYNTFILSINCNIQTTNIYVKCLVSWSIIELYSNAVLYDATTSPYS